MDAFLDGSEVLTRVVNVRGLHIWTGTYKGTALILMSPKCSPERQLFD